MSLYGCGLRLMLIYVNCVVIHYLLYVITAAILLRFKASPKPQQLK